LDALFLAVAAALPLAAISFAQAVPSRPAPAPSERPRFDVVSIKTCQASGAPGSGGDSSPGRLSIGCGILADTDNVGLIQVAYNRYASGKLTSEQMLPIEGGPDWIHSERFAIDAKADGQPSIQMMQGPMMQTILEERFKLKIHRETRQGPVYELALGKGPAKLKPLPVGKCIPVLLGAPMPVVPDGQHPCKRMASPRGVEIEGGTLRAFADVLGMLLDRPVIDKTGMTGYFQIQLAFSPADSAGPDSPDVFQAVQEQLGLRLVPAKGPVDVLVIDHIERPSEN